MLKANLKFPDTQRILGRDGPPEGTLRKHRFQFFHECFTFELLVVKNAVMMDTVVMSHSFSLFTLTYLIVY